MSDSQDKNISDLYIGVDLGTSGIRAIAIDPQQGLIAEASRPLLATASWMSEPIPELWWITLTEVLQALCERITPAQASAIRAIAVDGTSASTLLSDPAGTPLGPVLMYNDARAESQATRIAAVAPDDSAARGPTSGLAKLLYLLEHTSISSEFHVISQADWIRGRLGGRYDVSDVNNCLKMGYDAVNQRWPDWLNQLGVNTDILPTVVTPGTPLAHIEPVLADSLGLSADVLLVAGTTDSTAAFIATAANEVGDAVTSLGSTLVLKVISETPISAPEYGVYSQPLGEHWLAGGASNCGGAVLRQYFTDEQMDTMTTGLNFAQPTGLDYYPLPATGERFPVSDPDMQARLTPRPDSDVSFFQAMLEGIAHVEQRGYELLADLGAPYPVSVRSVGGGARNIQWTRMREQLLHVPVNRAAQDQAAFGSAILALQGYHQYQTQDR